MELAVRGALSVGIAAGMAWYGYSRRSLSASGALAALVVGTVTFLCGPHFGLLLIWFFLSSSRLTKYGAELKRARDPEYTLGGNRSAWQVLSNSLVATVLAVAYCWMYGFQMTPYGTQQDCSLWPLSPHALQVGFLGFYACCTGDTWSSELGILSKTEPILITSFKRVPHGTNGGVTAFGLFASVLGGFAMGLAWFSFLLVFSTGADFYLQLPAILHGILGGLLGSLLDSVLGATMQYSGLSKDDGKVHSAKAKGMVSVGGLNILSNSQVNVVSSTMIACTFAIVFRC